MMSRFAGLVKDESTEIDDPGQRSSFLMERPTKRTINLLSLYF
jgi:hypothetical protein